DKRRAGARQADDKDRIGGRGALAGGAREELGREHGAAAREVAADTLRVVDHARAPQGVAVTVMAERRLVLAAVLERLAQGEVKVKAVLGAQIAARQLRAHRADVGRREAKGLEVGETPPHLSEGWLELARAAVGVDALGRAAGGLEHMAVAQPHLAVTGIFAQYLLIDAGGARVLTDAGQHRGVQAAVVGISRLA